MRRFVTATLEGQPAALDDLAMLFPNIALECRRPRADRFHDSWTGYDFNYDLYYPDLASPRTIVLSSDTFFSGEALISKNTERYARIFACCRYLLTTLWLVLRNSLGKLVVCQWAHTS